MTERRRRVFFGFRVFGILFFRETPCLVIKVSLAHSLCIMSCCRLGAWITESTYSGLKKCEYCVFSREKKKRVKRKFKEKQIDKD